MNPFPAEHELVSLFEAEPTLLDKGVPWAYNQLRFEVSRGKDHLVCEIEPGNRQLRIIWDRSGTELVRMDLDRIAGIVVEVEKGRETLVARFDDSHLQDLRLQLRPQVHLAWGTAE